MREVPEGLAALAAHAELERESVHALEATKTGVVGLPSDFTHAAVDRRAARIDKGGGVPEEFVHHVGLWRVERTTGVPNVLCRQKLAAREVLFRGARTERRTSSQSPALAWPNRTVRGLSIPRSGSGRGHPHARR
jgi:hypothetical protein